MRRPATRMQDCLCALLLTGVLGWCHAQTYPARSIRLVVPFPPGGIADVAARTVGQKISERLGQQVVLDNRGGGNTIIGTEFVAKSAPDGYTLVSVPFNYGVNPSFYKKLPYDPNVDLKAVGLLGLSPNILVVHPSVPAYSVKELVALATARPGVLNFATGGAATSNHLAAELFKQSARIDMRHVPYKGAGPSAIALMSGEVSLSFIAVSSVTQQIKAGKLRALALTSNKRTSAFPDVPTMAEAGVANCEVSAWHGVMAPNGTAREIISLLNAEINHALQLRDVIERFAAMGFEPRPGSTEAFDKFIKAEIEKWGRVVRAAKIISD